tara:strand:+ start:460 stop:738 length:279 start_codon:yes stop_codon:yes gene_type:complete
MALEKASSVDKIIIRSPFNQLELRTAIVVTEDDVVIATVFDHKTISAGSLDSNDALVDTDMSGYSSEIQGVAAAVWTDAIKTNWKNHLISIK